MRPASLHPSKIRSSLRRSLALAPLAALAVLFAACSEAPTGPSSSQLEPASVTGFAQQQSRTERALGGAYEPPGPCSKATCERPGHHWLQ